MAKPSETLPAVLGFNPVSRGKITDNVLAKVKAELQAEREAEAEVRAKGIMKSALELCAAHEKTKKEFAKADAAFEKALGGLINQLNTGGQQQAPEAAEEGETKPAGQ